MKTESIDHSDDSVNRVLFKMTEGLVDHGYIGTVLRKRVLCKSRKVKKGANRSLKLMRR
jgi:hypothetical protein